MMNGLINCLEEALEIYEPMENYVTPPIPCDLDEAVSRLVVSYLKSSSLDRNALINRTTDAHSFMFIIFADRMASLGVREKSRQRLLEGLVALLIEGFKFDWRDTVTRFAPLYHASEKIGINPTELFTEAASYARNEVAKAMIEFTSRKPKDRSLETFMYKEVQAADGFRYEVIW